MSIPARDREPTSREILGVVYCPGCRADTIPLEPSGRCGFCDTQLADPLPPLIPFPTGRVRCRCGHGVGAHDDIDGACAGCPCALFTPAEVST